VGEHRDHEEKIDEISCYFVAKFKAVLFIIMWLRVCEQHQNTK
jgi:hypothetical protein